MPSRQFKAREAGPIFRTKFQTIAVPPTKIHTPRAPAPETSREANGDADVAAAEAHAHTCVYTQASHAAKKHKPTTPPTAAPSGYDNL